MLELKLTHWGRVTHICVGNLTIIGPDNGLSPGRRQAIIWTNAGILLIGPWGTNFSEILIGIHTFSFKKIHLKMSSAKWRPFCLGLNELKHVSKGDPCSSGLGWLITCIWICEMPLLTHIPPAVDLGAVEMWKTEPVSVFVMRNVLDRKHLKSFIAETVWFSATDLATRS